MVLHEPLDLEYWLINVFSGNMTIFALVSILVITSICAMFRMTTSTFLIMIVLYASILFSLGWSYLFILLILAGVFGLFYIIRRSLD